MSVEHVAVVLHHSRAKGTAKLVLLGIANHQGDGGAWPSVATLAVYASTTPRTVQKAIATLRGMGELIVDVQAGGPPEMADYDRPNRYHVKIECPPWCDRTPQHRDSRGPQVALWKNPPSVRTPPVDTDRGPLSQRTPHPPSVRTPKPTPEPTVTKYQPHSETARAWCTACGLNHPGRRHADGHDFQPRTAS